MDSSILVGNGYSKWTLDKISKRGRRTSQPCHQNEKLQHRLRNYYVHVYGISVQFKLQRTSDSLNEGLPIKMTREKFQRKWYFFYEKDSRFNTRLIHKSRFLFRQVPIEKYGLKTLFLPFIGWVVTWVLLGYTVRMFEYTVRTFWSNVDRFLYVFSSIPRKLYTIFQPTFPLSNATRIASLSFLLWVLTLSQMLSVQLISTFRPDLRR